MREASQTVFRRMSLILSLEPDGDNPNLATIWLTVVRLPAAALAERCPTPNALDNDFRRVFG